MDAELIESGLRFVRLSIERTGPSLATARIVFHQQQTGRAVLLTVKDAGQFEIHEGRLLEGSLCLQVADVSERQMEAVRYIVRELEHGAFEFLARYASVTFETAATSLDDVT